MSSTLGLTMVLVVNESREICKAWQRDIDMYPAMSCPGYATSGLQAVEKAQEFVPNVVVMPMTLPDADASRVAQQIVAQRDDILIVMYAPDETQRQAALQAGAVEFFPLPIEADRFTNLLRSVHKTHHQG